MSAVASDLLSPVTGQGRRPLRALVVSESRLLLREPGPLFWILAFPSVLLCILGLVPSFREPSTDLGGLAVIDLYVPVVILMAMIAAALMVLPPVLTGYRERGILRRLRTTTVAPSALLAAQIVVLATATVVSSALALLVGRGVFGVVLPREPLGYAVTFLLATLAAFCVGALISSVSSNGRVVGALGTAVFFPMMFTSGVYLPVSTMPDTLQQIVEATPLGAASQAFDQAAAGDWPGVVHLAVMLAWAVASLVLATRLFRWE